MTSAKSLVTVIVFSVSSLTTDLSAQVQWKQVTTSAEWQARFQHSAVVFNNKMWVMGGINDTIAINDVWYSKNGLKWMQASSNPGWSGRSCFTSVVFNDKIWVIGGCLANGENLNDVW